jgi:hypothetical protein
MKTDNPWNDYSDEELIDYLRNHPAELKLARAAPDMLSSLRKSRLIIALQAAGEFTSPEMVGEIQAEYFEIIRDVCGG